MAADIHGDGYVVIRKWLNPIPSLLAHEIRTASMSGKQEADIRDTCGFAKRVLQDFPAYRYGGAVFRHTPATCQMMDPHCDCQLSQKPTSDEEIPLTLLVALSDYAMIDLWPGSHRTLRQKTPAIHGPCVRMYLYTGDALLMRADVVHAGIKDNTARHYMLMIYINHPNHKRDPNSALVISRNKSGELCADKMMNRPALLR